jgi:hypothetical protein
MFTKENTRGYSQDQLDALNTELSERLELAKKENPDFDYLEKEELEKEFSNEVASR